MTRSPRRATVALVIALACLLAILYMNGCAMTPEYRWTRVGPPSKSYQWKVVPYSELHAICRQPSMANLGACVFHSEQISTVYSFMSEEQAKRTMSADGIDLWTHEMRHVNGEAH